ncbi:hypothetical protein [Caballeronia sp. GAFFF1]|uniref:hypothetical protein n=1 Tax=Caballeronia sp. GAFFF1 TaxID=2921779 RepID=UPI00202942C4|nr:hypothetical protein [Caballeronia sp. GAFFF1]
MSQEEMSSEVLAAAGAGDELYLLFIDYDEGNIASATGDVFTLPAHQTTGTAPRRVLETSDSLRCMWASPQGSVWTGSADGTVATTARVAWPPPTGAVRYRTEAGSRPWSATDLPVLRSTRLPPNITVLWGLSDDDVYAGTYGGHIYHWDGSAWIQQYEGPGDGDRTIRAFAGGPGDVYAVGEMQTLLHFDGTGWRALSVPAPVDLSENLTGICRGEGKDMLIAASGALSRLLQGSASAGFVEFGRYEVPLLGMDKLNDRILFAADEGAAELIGRDVQMIRTSFQAVTIWIAGDRVYFVPPDQPPPSVIEYAPYSDGWPWTILEF